MKNKRVFFASLMLLFGTVSLLADTRQYRLDEVLQLVKERNLEVKVSEFEEKIRSYDVRIVNSKRLGQLDFVQSYANTNHAGYVFGMKMANREAKFADFGFDQFLGWMQQGMEGDVLSIEPNRLNEPESYESHESKLEYKVPIYTGGLLDSYEKITESLHRLSKIETKSLLNEKLFEAKKSYYDILLLDNFEKNLKTILEAIERLELSVQAMIDEGYAKNIDLLEVQTKKANILRLLNQTVANRALVYDYISFLSDTNIERVETIDIEIKKRAITKEETVESNTDLQKIEVAQKITEDALRLKQSGFYPTLGAMFSGGYTGSSFLSDRYLENGYYMAGVELRWNIFNGGADSDAVQQAKIERNRLKTQADLAKKGIALQYAKIETEIESLEYDINSLKKELELKEGIYDNYQARYKEKLVSINDVLIKHSERIEATLQLQKVQNSRNKKIFELEKLANIGE